MDNPIEMAKEKIKESIGILAEMQDTPMKVVGNLGFVMGILDSIRVQFFIDRKECNHGK